MKIKDLSNKIGRMTKGSVEIRQGSEKLTQTTFNTFCFDQSSMSDFLGMTVTFFNIGVTEKGDIHMVIQVK